ncbi:hypothetical protein F8M41_022965 [Gigaspora margarita]|uniref:Secreted protein n=1 Tax=Gigaspora margarita TaxID=4874 RepID=A0A8H4AE74_GIGMA|nr:hypothetical protein F8M41_022965 [Gigaspora margarita]
MNSKCLFVFLLVFFVFEVYSSNKSSSSSTKPPQEQKQTIQNGEACVFYRNINITVPVFHKDIPTLLIGHVAWGFRIGNNNKYIYGSDDGSDNKCGGNKTWQQYSGTRAEMLSWFKKENYNYYYCKNTVNPKDNSAQNKISERKKQKYYVNNWYCDKHPPTNNCLTDTFEILYAYNMLELPVQTKSPTFWFGYWCGNENDCWWTDVCVNKCWKL